MFEKIDHFIIVDQEILATTYLSLSKHANSQGHLRCLRKKHTHIKEIVYLFHELLRDFNLTDYFLYFAIIWTETPTISSSINQSILYHWK